MAVLISLKHTPILTVWLKLRVAKARIALGLGFTSGMKVSYVVTDASRSPMAVKPWLESEEDGGISDYDSKFYAERLAAALGRRY